MITPAVLISASGTLVLSTSNRLTRIVDRVRVLAVEAEGVLASAQAVDQPEAEIAPRMALIEQQIPRLSARVALLRTALTALYVAIGLLVTTSLAVGIDALFAWAHPWIPVSLGLAGASALLGASVLLIREARLAIGSTIEEMAYLERAVHRRAKRR